MEFRIADTFTDSLSRLTSEEQESVKTTAFDLQINPANPSLQFHKVEKAKDQNFWSLPASGNLCLIVHRTQTSVLLCYVNHHDDAYRWVERRKMDAHPKTGAAQLVEIRETMREIPSRSSAEPEAKQAAEEPAPFSHIPDTTLLGYGIPPEWLDAVHSANEESILVVAAHLPAEAAEAVLDLAVGIVPKTAERLMAGADPFSHPDAQRRFRAMHNVDELERALNYPAEKWIVFLHPLQRQLVERKYNGPARVSGSAGTGKTTVALHRAVDLTRNHPNAHVLLTTFSESLANALHGKLRCLIGNEPRLAERLEIYAIHAIGRRLYEANIGRAQIASREMICDLLAGASKASRGHKFSAHFLHAEWEQIVDPWQLASSESYRDVSRLGRKSRLNEAQRAALWPIFERVRSGLKERGLITQAEMFTLLAGNITKAKQSSFDFTVVDEAQDISVPQLRFLAALGIQRPDGLFFAGDLGQRIFEAPFSWKSLGVDVRGRGTTLKINYRASHQIRARVERLLSPEISDVDGNSEKRKGTVSLFNGPPPDIRTFDSNAAENKAVSAWLKERIKEGSIPHEIALLVRSGTQIPRAAEAAKLAGVPFKVLGEVVQTSAGHASVCTMHLAKGLEFCAVAVMACDDKIIPKQEHIETVADDSDLEEVYNIERHLLYVACSRARNHLLVTGTKPASKFLDDFAAG